MSAHEKGIKAAADVVYRHERDVEDHEDVASDVIRAYLEASDQVLVPREPTKEMIQIGNDTIEKCIDSWNYDSGSGYMVESFAANSTFASMVAAYPQPFSQDNTTEKP